MLSVEGAVSQMKTHVPSTVKRSQKMRDLKNFLHTMKMSNWNLVMFLNENMFVECVCLFYENSTGLALCSLFSTIELCIINTCNLINQNSDPTIHSKSFLKHWFEKLAPQKSRLKSKQNPEKQNKRFRGLLSSQVSPPTSSPALVIQH